MIESRPGLSRAGWIAIGWYVLFLAGPLAVVAVASFGTRGAYGGIEWGFDLANYARAFDPIYSIIVARSLVLALVTSVACFVIGFPMAYAMATLGSRARTIFVFALAIPFLTNLIVRICAIKSVVAYDGPLPYLLEAVGFQVDRFAISQNGWLVLYGMLSSYLPFMVFPLYAALERFDFSLVEAAMDLGADFRRVLFLVVIPRLRTAIVSGILLVFIPAFGEFLIPDLLGGAKTMLIGNLISEQFLKSRDWPFGAALSVLLMIGLGATIALLRRMERRA